MSVDQTNVVDFVTVDHQSGDVLLTISDHLPWEDKPGEHLFLLQEKLNAYLRFVESGELRKQFPALVGKNIVFNIVLKYEPPTYARNFLANAAGFLENAGFGFKWAVSVSH